MMKIKTLLRFLLCFFIISGLNGFVYASAETCEKGHNVTVVQNGVSYCGGNYFVEEVSANWVHSLSRKCSSCDELVATTNLKTGTCSSGFKVRLGGDDTQYWIHDGNTTIYKCVCGSDIEKSADGKYRCGNDYLVEEASNNSWVHVIKDRCGSCGKRVVYNDDVNEYVCMNDYIVYHSAETGECWHNTENKTPHKCEENKDIKKINDVYTCECDYIVEKVNDKWIHSEFTRIVCMSCSLHNLKGFIKEENSKYVCYRLDGEREITQCEEIIFLNKDIAGNKKGYYHASSEFVYCGNCQIITTKESSSANHRDCFTNHSNSIVSCMKLSNASCECTRFTSPYKSHAGLFVLSDNTNSIKCGVFAETIQASGGRGYEYVTVHNTNDVIYTTDNNYCASPKYPKFYCADAEVYYACLKCKEGTTETLRKFSLTGINCNCKGKPRMVICEKTNKKCEYHGGKFLYQVYHQGNLIEFCNKCFKGNGSYEVIESLAELRGEEDKTQDNVMGAGPSAEDFFGAGDPTIGIKIVDENLKPVLHIQSLIIKIGVYAAVIIIMIFGIQWTMATPSKRQELKAGMIPLVLGVFLLVAGPSLAMLIINTFF